MFTVELPRLGQFVMVSSPDLIRQIFTEGGETLHAGRANGVLEPLVGPRSVLLLDGPQHMRHRKLLLPPFHGERMHAYADEMRQITEADLRTWPVGEPFSLHPHMQSITLSVILRAVFGLEEGAQMTDLAAKLVAFMEPPPALLVFLPHVAELDFPMSPLRRFRTRREAVDRDLYALIAERRRAKDLAARKDILSLLLSARDEDGKPMSDEEVRDELMTMLAAGHETTATALSWAFERTLNEPRVATKMAAEVREVVGDGPLSPEAIARLTYVDAAVKETLRLQPILPIVVRYLEEPYSIGGYDLPAGSRVAPCIYLTHRRPELYPEPEQFDPSRFVGKKVDPYTWLPFGGGIRRCIGMAFALYEMKLILATVMARARLRLESLHPARVVRRGVTLAPSEGARVVLTEPLP
jgi:cytochrome P450